MVFSFFLGNGFFYLHVYSVATVAHLCCIYVFLGLDETYIISYKYENCSSKGICINRSTSTIVITSLKCLSCYTCPFKLDCLYAYGVNCI